LIAGLAIAASWERLPMQGTAALRSRTIAAMLVAALALAVVIVG
jgi:hypothetical protein